MYRILIVKQLCPFSDGHSKHPPLNLFLFSSLDEISGRSHSFSSPSQSLEKSHVGYENEKISEIRTIFHILQVKALSLQFSSNSDRELFCSRAWHEHSPFSPKPSSLILCVPASNQAGEGLWGNSTLFGCRDILIYHRFPLDGVYCTIILCFNGVPLWSFILGRCHHIIVPCL